MKRLASVALAGLVALSAFPALAEKTAPASKAFSYLDRFLKVPTAERSRMRLNYAFTQDGKPIPNLKVVLVEANGARTPLPVNADGVVERLPTLAQLEGGAKISLNLPEDAKIGSNMSFETQLKPAGEYEVRELKACVDEANTVIGKAAGVAAMLAPKMTGVTFGKASAGVAVFADGRTQPLPTIRETPYFRLDDFKGAVRVKLTKSPTKVGFYSGKK